VPSIWPIATLIAFTSLPPCCCLLYRLLYSANQQSWTDRAAAAVTWQPLLACGATPIFSQSHRQRSSQPPVQPPELDQPSSHATTSLTCFSRDCFTFSENTIWRPVYLLHHVNAHTGSYSQREPGVRHQHFKVAPVVPSLQGPGSDAVHDFTWQS
jgi:hypothetical protein